MERNYNILEKQNMLLSTYKNYENYHLENNLVEFDPEHHLYEEDYDELKKVIINCYKYDENFGSKIVLGIYIIIYEKIIDCKNLLYFQKTIDFQNSS